jgi:hypothetical protein
MGTSVAIPMEKSLEILIGAVERLPDAPSDDDFEARIVARILSAETLEAAFEPPTADSLGMLEGAPLRIHAVFKKPSLKNKALGYFLLLDVEDKVTGNRNVYSSGSVRIVAEMIRAVQEDRLPLDCWVQTSTSTETGNTSHWLVLKQPF